MGRISYKSLYQYVVEQVDKRSSFSTSTNYNQQLSRTAISPNVDASRTDASVSELITAIQNLLEDAISPTIIEGLEVTAASPISSSVTVSAGKGSAGGKLYELAADITLTIPFDNTSYVFYIVLYRDSILIEKTYSSNKLTIAKIMVPNPGVTSLVQNDKDTSWNAYIVNFKEYKLYGYHDKFEEDTIELLRNNISPILADNLIGNIRLTEDLKIINTAGTLELNSDSLKFYNSSSQLLSKFNTRGVFFNDSNQIELAKFTGSSARLGNIEIYPSYLQSQNFVSGSAGFRISDDGNAEFNDLTARGTIYANNGEIGGFTITNSSLYATTTGTIKTSVNAGSGYNGVVLDKDGLRVYDDILGMVVNLPSDGSAPSFANGTIQETIFEINTNAVLRTSSTVGDGSSLSYGVLINNTGIYGCEANQTLDHANFKVLNNGNVYLKGEIIAATGKIGSVTITSSGLYGGLIEGSLIRAPIIESSNSFPRIRMDEKGFYYMLSASTGKYGEILYGSSNVYGVGVLAYLFNTGYPVLSIETELSDLADIHLYDRSDNPDSGTHRLGDLICVDGRMKRCSVVGSPGTFVDLTDIENRTSDPVSPSIGQIWLRTDL